MPAPLHALSCPVQSFTPHEFYMSAQSLDALARQNGAEYWCVGERACWQDRAWLGQQAC